MPRPILTSASDQHLEYYISTVTDYNCAKDRPIFKRAIRLLTSTCSAESFLARVFKFAGAGPCQGNDLVRGATTICYESLTTSAGTTGNVIKSLSGSIKTAQRSRPASGRLPRLCLVHCGRSVPMRWCEPKGRPSCPFGQCCGFRRSTDRGCRCRSSRHRD